MEKNTCYKQVWVKYRNQKQTKPNFELMFGGFRYSLNHLADRARSAEAFVYHSLLLSIQTIANERFGVSNLKYPHQVFLVSFPYLYLYNIRHQVSLKNPPWAPGFHQTKPSISYFIFTVFSRIIPSNQLVSMEFIRNAWYDSEGLKKMVQLPRDHPTMTSTCYMDNCTCKNQYLPRFFRVFHIILRNLVMEI